MDGPPRRLSDITGTKYAYCSKCREWFIDDVSIDFGGTRCPNDCGKLLERGFKQMNLPESMSDPSLDPERWAEETAERMVEETNRVTY